MFLLCQFYQCFIDILENFEGLYDDILICAQKWENCEVFKLEGFQWLPSRQ